MKVALVHDYLNQMGGAERVLEALIDVFPKAPVYTLLYDKKRTHGRFHGKSIRRSLLNVPWVRTHHRLFIPLMPFAIRAMHLESRYDLIISDSAGFAKGIPHDRATRHIAYIHTPLRYAWETDTYFGEKRHRWFKKVFKFLFSFVRRMDFQFAQYPDILLANSNYIAQKIKKYYHRDAQVVYPPVDTDTFFFDPKTSQGDYYLAAGRFLPYKRFDLIVRTFNDLKKPLVIVGAGKEKKRLQRLADSNHIRFLPFQTDEELQSLYAGAKALIFPQIEDFGLVAAEAQACGTPVIAAKGGGALEIIEEGKTGILFAPQTEEELKKAIERFEKLSWDRSLIAKSAQRFSPEAFREGIRSAIAKIGL